MPALPRTTLASLATLAFLLWCALAALLALRGDVGGDAPGLVPPDHHPSAGYHVRLDLRGMEDEAAWSQLVDQLGPRLPGHRPLAPPPAEARAWLDAHLLYRLAPAEHAALARRLETDALKAAVAGLRARLASPLFAVGDEDPRRDPLGLHELGDPRPGLLGSFAADGPVVTASGDLLSADGRTLLLYLRTGTPPARLHAWISAQLAARFGVGPGIEVHVLPLTIRAVGPNRPSAAVIDLLAAGLATLTLALALGLRRVRSALALVLSLAAVVPLVLLFVGGFDALAAPLLLALLGVAAGLATDLTPQPGPRTWTAALRLAVALVPLALLPYPVWQRWALVWALALLALVVAGRAVAPALARRVSARAPEPAAPTVARPWPRSAALALCSALLAGGAWSFGHVSGDILETSPDDAALAARFFAPTRVAELTSAGPDERGALAAAAAEVGELTALVPDIAVRLDAPGAHLLDEAACAARLAGLTALDLAGRIELLRVIVSEQGLRPDAFGEALRGLDPARQPTPEAALAGPLALWFGAHLERGDSEVLARSRVELADPLPADAVLPARLRGPAVFAHHEQRARHARLGLALVVGAWLSAFLTWLTARRLSTAISAALIGLATQAGALLLAIAAGAAAVALVLPPLLLVGALAADAAARVLQPVPSDSPGRPLLALACQVAPALVLLASPDPAWRGFGLLLGFGAILGHALATRAAPGLCALLRRGEEARG